MLNADKNRSNMLDLAMVIHPTFFSLVSVRWLSGCGCLLSKTRFKAFLSTHSHTHSNPAADTILLINHHTFTSPSLICTVPNSKHAVRETQTPTSLAFISLPRVHLLQLSLRAKPSTLKLGVLTVLGGVTG